MKDNKRKFSRLLAAGVLALALLVHAGCQPRENSYGAPIDPTKGSVVELRTVFARTAEYLGKNVIVEGTTGQVCQTSGCWLTLGDGTHQLFIQFYTFTAQLPVGSDIRVQGVLRSRNQIPYLAGEGLEIRK